MPSADALSDAEIEELDEFLLNAEGIEESMDISTLDGFLTAIVCGPRTILPSEWLRWVWDMERGKDAPHFKDHAEAQKVLGLMMRHMNDIARTLHQASENFEPVFMENPNRGDPVPVIDEWCCGFMKGVRLDSEGWLPVLVGRSALMSTILLYGTEEGRETLKKKNLPLAPGRVQGSGQWIGRYRPQHSCALARRTQQAGRLRRITRRCSPTGQKSPQGRPQPAVSLRIRQEVQALPWQRTAIALKHSSDMRN